MWTPNRWVVGSEDRPWRILPTLRLRRAQAVARGFADRMRVAALRLERQRQVENHAATTVQAWFRGCLARQQLHRQRAAATTLQAWWRMACARRAFTCQQRSTVVVQAAWRWVQGPSSKTAMHLGSITCASLP